MRQLLVSKYKIVACSCVLVALQSTSGRAAPPANVSPYYQPAQAAPEYYGPPSGNPQAMNRPDYPRQQYYNPQGRSPGYSHPDWYAKPGYGRPDYRQYDSVQESYPAAYDNTGPVTSQGADNMNTQPASPVAVTPNVQAAGKVSAGAAIVESDSLTHPEMNMNPAIPAIQSGMSTKAEGLTEQRIEKVAGKIKADDTAATQQQPVQWLSTPLAAPSTASDPTLTMSAPAAGAAETEDLVEQTIEKNGALVKTEDTAATAAAPVPAAEMADPQDLVDQTIEKTEDMVKAGDTEATPAAQLPAIALEPVTAPGAATGTPEQPTKWMPAPLAAPAAPTDPTLTMPAPAAGTTETGDLMEYAAEKAEGITKAVDTATTSAVPVPAAALEPATTPGAATGTPEQPTKWMPAPLAAPAAPTDPTLTMPAPAAGTTETGDLMEHAAEKAEEITKAVDPATTSAVPVPAAVLEPATAPGAATGTPEQPTKWMPAPLAAPAAPTDPTLTMPAPAAGTAEPVELVDKATRKVEGILKTDIPATPEAK